MKTARIVAIDEKIDTLNLLKLNLEKERAQVHTYTSGWEALKAIRQEVPDMIVSDWMLEDVEGLDICRQIKMNPDLRHIPFVMLSERCEEIDVVTALEIGAEDYMVKPIRMREFIARIKKILCRCKTDTPSQPQETTGSETTNVLKYKAFLLDIDKHKAYLENNPLDLTYSEFRLLQLLMNRPGRVYSRGQIIEKLNGLDYIATERSVDVQVVGLRKKIGKYKNYLETVRGVGYRFRE
jgi:DNA-binding response OmpR family regulator